jgi:hypothetical protein
MLLLFSLVIFTKNIPKPRVDVDLFEKPNNQRARLDKVTRVLECRPAARQDPDCDQRTQHGIVLIPYKRGCFNTDLTCMTQMVKRASPRNNFFFVGRSRSLYRRIYEVELIYDEKEFVTGWPKLPTVSYPHTVIHTATTLLSRRYVVFFRLARRPATRPSRTLARLRFSSRQRGRTAATSPTLKAFLIMKA